MNRKISDYKVSHYFIRSMCHALDVPFVDAEVSFDSDRPAIVSGKMCIVKPDHWAQLQYQLIMLYAESAGTITGKRVSVKKKSLHSLSSSVISLLRFMSSPIPLHSDPVLMRTNRDPFLWTIARDIFMPITGCEPDPEARLVAACEPSWDVGMVIRESDDIPEKHLPCAFSNFCLGNQAVRLGFLVLPALEVMGFEREECKKMILNDPLVSSAVGGLARLHFGEKSNEFGFAFLLSSGETPDDDDVKKVFAQYTMDAAPYWRQGLIEKMIEPVRAPDLVTHEELEDMRKELWDRVEEKKKETGLNPLPYEEMLRAHAEEFHDDGKNLIQKMLSDKRIW